VQSKLEQLVDMLEVFVVVLCEVWHFPVHLKLLSLVHTYKFQSTSVMLFKATGPDLILHSSHWFASGPSPHHPIISHWRFFHGLFLSLEEGGSNGVPVNHTVQHHIAPDSSLCSNGCENLCVTWLTYDSWVAEASHHEHTTAQVPKPYVISTWQPRPLSLTFSTYDSWVPQPHMINTQ